MRESSGEDGDEIGGSQRSETLPLSPSHSFTSSFSSDFEFSICISPGKSSTTLCPADELFYKGQLLPLDVSPRLSVVRTLLSSSGTSSEATSTTASRDSSGSSNDSHSSFTSDNIFLPECYSSRPSSVTEDDEFRRLSNLTRNQIKKNKYFSLSRFSSVFRKESKNRESEGLSASHVKQISSTAKEVIRKYLKKVKPLYEKLSQKQNHQKHQPMKMCCNAASSLQTERSAKDDDSLCKKSVGGESGESFMSHSFSGNLRYQRRRSSTSSCPSSIMSSPSHATMLYRPRFPITGPGSRIRGMNTNYTPSPSSMEELQSTIQSAIAHCKNSMIQSSVQGIGYKQDLSNHQSQA